MANKALSYLSTTLLQGGADAFVQASIQTALTGLTKTAYLLRTLEIEIAAALGVSNAAGANYEVSLTRKSFAAMPTVLEKAIIAKWKRQGNFATSGWVFVDGVMRLNWDEGEAPLIVEDPVYVQLDSASTAVVNTVYVRLGYQVVSISEIDRLTLVANSLS